MDEKTNSCECCCKTVTRSFCIVSVLAALFLGVILGFIFSPVKNGVGDISIGSGNSGNGCYNTAENKECAPPRSKRKLAKKS